MSSKGDVQATAILVDLRSGFETGSTLQSERVRNVLTDEITRGDVAPGTLLDEQEIADRFGVSRTPVREALRQLVVTGLVEMRPRRGVIVTVLTPERIMDLFEAMAEMEALCVRVATHRMSPVERSSLIRLHEESEALVEARDIDRYDAFNREFHERLYRSTRNSVLIEQAMSLRMRLTAFRRTQLRHGQRLERSRKEHAAVLAAIAQGDGDAAGRQMRAHMLNAASALESYIKGQTGA